MLGVCYYPEHWPETRWAEDARRMRALGLTYVRIGEFAWSRLEPHPGQLDFGWLDRAIDTLGSAGLRVVLGTPTATPPKWLVDRTPRMLPVDREGRTRGFGSRRHSCFSSATYARECERIVTLLGERYGHNASVAGWQLDNEYGCHDTVRCYCANCQEAFRAWLQRRHGSLQALNQAWGNVFWSMEYRAWEEVELPHLTVTEANPSHWLDYYRFASDQVVAFNRLQVDLLRRLSPERFLAHNYMGFSTDFDHFRVAADLDVASWDSYPLGFTDQLPLPADVKQRYARTGHPDIAAFHHDLYRAVGRGRWWVMEQQPGPVNWASHNPAPAPGMVRLWTWEALAHGAEVVSYFRWRQAPFAQEQMHAGLHRPDSAPDVGFFEVEQTARELMSVKLGATLRAPVALVFDHEADWVLSIQPQGKEFQYKSLVLEWYTAIRRLGFDVDIVPPGASLDGYPLVLVPSLPIISDAALKAFEACKGRVIFGPRSGSKTAHFQIPGGLPPGPLQRLLDVKVTRVESLAPEMTETLDWQGRRYEARLWLEHLDVGAVIEARFSDGKPAVICNGRVHYLGCVPDSAFLMDWFEVLAREANLAPLRLPEGVRLRRRGGTTFAFNSDSVPWRAPVPAYARILLGDGMVPPQGVCAWG
ncbi:beta-galactosidase [Hyalangium sp.]|uniref:beta-galactosidase n=1 Tax=Hyalangium sp. TaxID=2028555 RepID=UPI002D40418A|nr:beta-galactosidase [Hyalangium sp.]HYI01447.1 beta-galactosidase [Hyalangium sp.]